MVARGEGHQSYITAVAFDPYTTVLPESTAATTTNAVPQSKEEAAQVNQVLSPRSARWSGIETSSCASSPFLGRLASEAGEREVVAYRLGSVGQDAQLCLWDLSEDALKIRRPFTRTRSRPSRMISQPQQSTGTESTAGTLSNKQRVGGQESKGVDVANARPRSDALDQELHKPLTDGLTRDDTPSDPSQQKNHKQNPASSKENGQHVAEKNGESNSHSDQSKDKESSPTGSDQSTERKKAKKTKDKAKVKNDKKVNRAQQRSFRDPMKRVMRFVGMGGQHHNGRREVSAFETCNSDDIAPKMDEVNVIEPLVAERVDQERLSDLVFRDDCIVVASYDGLVSLWARPGVESSDSKQSEEKGEEKREEGRESQQVAAMGTDQPEPHPGVRTSVLY